MKAEKYALLPRLALISTHGYVASDPPLGAADTGGQVVYVLELAKKLARLGYEVDIFTRQFEIQPQIDECGERVRIVRIPCGGRDFIPKEYLYRSLDAWCENALQYIRLRRHSYAFINSHYWDAGIAGQRLSRVLSVPHIHTPHSLGTWKRRQVLTDYPELEGTFETEFNFRDRISHECAILDACDYVVATTPDQADILQRDYGVPPARIHMIPPGYDDGRFFPVSAASRTLLRQHLGFDGKVVLSLGRLATNKGYDLLIDAFAVLAERQPEAKLFLALGGTELNDTEEAMLGNLRAQVGAMRLTDKVIFSGHIPDEDLADYYRAADIFVLSSRYEPFGMTAIEAMACGTPTVITTNGGLFRAVNFGRHALFADPFDKYDLGITMMKVVRHEKLSGRLSRMGAHKARSLFTWTGIAQELIAIVEGRGYVQTLEDDEWAEPWNDGD